MNNQQVYNAYKPLRNYLRNFPLHESLKVVHAYIQFLQFKNPFPKDIEVHDKCLLTKRAEKGIYEWELDILAREIILNCPETGSKSLKAWPNLAGAINRIKELENEITIIHSEKVSSNILLELHRTGHRQFPWQRSINNNAMLRYFRIFGTDAFIPIFQEKIGLPAAYLYRLGLCFTGHFIDTYECILPLDVSQIEMTTDMLDTFVRHFSMNIADLKRLIAEAQCYDEDYAYTLNPMRFYPFIKTELHGKLMLLCYSMPYVCRRFTEGVYYEVCGAEGFGKAFGDSFQQYVGDVANAANKSKKMSIFPEKSYQIGKNKKTSIDWIISDSNADLFIECKTKKMRLISKVSLASKQLDEDLDKMADFIAQMYRTLADALSGHYPHWKPTDKPIYPIITVLEEWYTFGKVIPTINEKTRAKLTATGIDAAILEKHPYTICAIEDLEFVLQVMDKVGIANVMSKKVDGERQQWQVISLLQNDFKDELKECDELLFPHEYEKIHPALGQMYDRGKKIVFL